MAHSVLSIIAMRCVQLLCDHSEWRRWRHLDTSLTPMLEGCSFLMIRSLHFI